MSQNRPPAIVLKELRGSSMPGGYVLGRVSGGHGQVEMLSLAHLQTLGIPSVQQTNQVAAAAANLDQYGNARGDILFRAAAKWTVLAPGTSGQVLKTNGAGADPSWLTLAAVATSGSASDLGSGTLPDARLSNTITAGGPTGDATHVPIITYDAHGRLTAVSTAVITGGDPNYVHGAGAPSSGLGSTKGTVYTDTTNGDLYECEGTAAGVVTIVQSAKAALGTGNPSVTMGAGPTQGNLLLALGTHWGGNGSQTANAGWTLKETVNPTGSTDGVDVFYKYAGAGESTTQTPYATTQQSVCVIFEISGVSGTWATDFVEEHHTTDIAAATTMTTSSYNTAVNNETIFGLAVGLIAWFNGTDSTPTITGGGATSDQSGNEATGTTAHSGYIGYHKAVATAGTAVQNTVSWGATSQDTKMCYVEVGLQPANVTSWAKLLRADKNLSELASASVARTNLGLAIGTNVQAWDADLDALAALSGTNNIYYRSAANTWSPVTIGSGVTFSGGTLSATGSGTVTTTGSPASGNLTKFSGTTSVTNGDLSGDITTSGTLATTLATVNANVGTFGSGTAIPIITVNAKGLITAVSTAAAPQSLSANITYYVRTNGSDSNTGLVNTAGGAWLTLNHAYSVIQLLNFNGFTVTIQIADGTYSTTSSSNALLDMTLSWYGGGALVVKGNTTTPANVVISPASGLDGVYMPVTVPGPVTFSGMKFTIAGGGTCALDISGSNKVLFDHIEFGTAGRAHISASAEASITATSNYTISGAAPRHAVATTLSTIFLGVPGGAATTITLTGTPAFSVAFAVVGQLAAIICPATTVTFSGSATGSRYSGDLNGIFAVNGGSTTYFPGNAVGTLTNGAQYA